MWAITSAVNEALVAAHAAGTGLPALTVANTPYVAEYGRRRPYRGSDALY